MRVSRPDLVIGILILIIFILAMVIVYVFAIRPAITAKAIDTYNKGVEYTIFAIMQQAITCQTVPLTFGNQTINMVAVECLQAPPKE